MAAMTEARDRELKELTPPGSPQRLILDDGTVVRFGNSTVCVASAQLEIAARIAATDYGTDMSTATPSTRPRSAAAPTQRGVQLDESFNGHFRDEHLNVESARRSGGVAHSSRVEPATRYRLRTQSQERQTGNLL
jgi:hypothetical protein